jgi:hypothetical protein
MNYIDTKPYRSAFLSVDLLTDFAAFCLTDFIDWRYIHSWFVFRPSLWTVAPTDEGTILVYCCPSTVPSLWPPPPSPSQCTVGTDSVWLGGDVEMYCGPYSAWVLHCVSDQIQIEECKIVILNKVPKIIISPICFQFNRMTIASRTAHKCLS